MILEKYVDKLPLPTTLKPKEEKEGIPYYEVVMKEITQQLHRDMPKTKLWGYEGSYPGPTIEALSYKPIIVKWINNLPIKKHLLPVDTTIHGAGPDTPKVRTVVHVHGANVPPENDGYPEAWFTRNFSNVGPYFTREEYYYPNKQEATTLWYHDHAIGITRLNVYAGLAGFYILRNTDEDKLNLPKEKYEIPLVIQDRSFNEDGSLFYPTQPDPPVPEVNPSIVPEFFGDTILVNGKVWPYLEVEPRKYRFRLLNGSNSRFYRLSFDFGQGDPNFKWIQIGTDGGFLEKPVELNQLILAPAERADVILDFTDFYGKEIIITNDAPTPFPMGDDPDPNTTGQIMKFKVTLPLEGTDTSTIPNTLNTIKHLSEKNAVNFRNLTLEESTDKYGRLMMMLNGMMWDDPITEKVKLNSIEVWNMINLTVDTHPMHLHLVQFQILNRTPFDVDAYMATGELIYTGPPEPPESNERGWKDTFRTPPGYVSRIIAKFGHYTGRYVWHCHILEHEDHDMMRPYKVLKKPCDSENCL